MDGVLFNSMPYHARAWHKAMADFGLDLSEEEAYMHEGRTGFSTIQIVAARKGLTATSEMAEEMYRVKSAYFSQFPEPDPMPGALPLIRKMQAEGIMLLLVTGSGTTTLLQQLNEFYPDVFVPERMVTGFDVKKGKPDPEPYLMGLAKGSAVLGRELRADECLVVENAPLGVRAAVAAHIPTIAVNTGPLPDSVLLDEGAKWLFPSMQALCEAWPQFTMDN
ncbi:MAG: HAD hydrolase-like protein [Bacteroidaceae bacterium]|nr:HAD hydrolase-like protein [Bacteroidaceae bacterium]